MKGTEFEQLFAIAQRKHLFDQTNSWAQGSTTYFDALKNEITEVEEELTEGRRVHLEEELGDVLWDYLNLLLCLDEEQQISIADVLNRTIEKFDERVTGIEQGESWASVKARQKERLAALISSETSE